MIGRYFPEAVQFVWCCPPGEEFIATWVMVPRLAGNVGRFLTLPEYQRVAATCSTPRTRRYLQGAVQMSGSQPNTVAFARERRGLLRARREADDATALDFWDLDRQNDDDFTLQDLMLSGRAVFDPRVAGRQMPTHGGWDQPVDPAVTLHPALGDPMQPYLETRNTGSAHLFGQKATIGRIYAFCRS